MAGSAPAPGTRAATSVGLCRVIQSSQSGHQEPVCSLALASQLLMSALRGFGPVQYWYFRFAGGLMTPAIWPDPDTTNRTSPPNDFEPTITDFAGAMWSSRVARL